MLAPKDYRNETSVRIRRGRVDSVDLYEVKDSELDLLEKGSPASLQLNFSIFLLSLAFSSIAAIATATFTSQIVETIFVFIMVVGLAMGIYLLFSWYKTKQSISGTIQCIRARISPDCDEDFVPDYPGRAPPPPVDENRPVG